MPSSGDVVRFGHLHECPGCGQLQTIGDLPPRGIARCFRCHDTLRRRRGDPIRRPLACATAGLVLFAAIISLQFMGIEIFGRGRDATLLAFPAQLTADGFWELGGLFLLFILVFPPLKLLLLLAVLCGLRLRHPPRVLRRLFRWFVALGPWAMIEVFLVGVFVAYTRLIGLATVGIGAAAWGLGALMLTIVAAEATLDPEVVWNMILLRCGPAHVPATDHGRLTGCTCCAQVVRVPPEGAACPRCGTHVWVRKPASVARTWALLIAACICAIGAYAYPIMTVMRLGQGAPMTIIAGIIELFAIGWWPIGIIVFVASLTIPLLKLAALGFMLIGVHRRSAWALRPRTRLYRFVEAIGRWSMIDIFMISILTALVQFGFFGTVHPDPGAIAFAAVVLLTMLAAYSFDPRLMWDAASQADQAE